MVNKDPEVRLREENKKKALNLGIVNCLLISRSLRGSCAFAFFFSFLLFYQYQRDQSTRDQMPETSMQFTNYALKQERQFLFFFFWEFCLRKAFQSWIVLFFGPIPTVFTGGSARSRAQILLFGFWMSIIYPTDPNDSGLQCTYPIRFDLNVHKVIW